MYVKSGSYMSSGFTLHAVSAPKSVSVSSF